MLLASLDDAGVRTERALEAIASASRDRATRAAATHVADRVRAGTPISTAFREVGAPSHVVTLIAGGERSGRIGDAFRGASELVRRLAQLGSAFRRALVYPSAVLVIGTVIVMFVAIAVVPAMERSFADLGGELPLPTVVVLRVSAWLRSGWSIATFGTAAVAVRLLAARHRHAIASWIRERTPIAGRLERDLQLAVVTRTCATMLRAGVPIVDVLHTIAGPMPPGRVRSGLVRAAAAVERGEGLVADDGLVDLLDDIELEMLRVAAENGLEAEQWGRVADRRAESLEERVRRMGALLEPLLVVAVGLMVGGAVLALYLPTFRALELL
jgi:type IV pilus assembly protein PilC